MFERDVCFQCNKKTWRSKMLLRRGFRYCSAACLDAFLAENKLITPPGAPETWAQEYANLLGSAIGELGRACGASPGDAAAKIITGSGIVISVVVSAALPLGGVLSQHRLDDVADALGRFRSLLPELWPYAAALGGGPDLDYLETIDTDDLSPGAARAIADRLRLILQRL